MRETERERKRGMREGEREACHFLVCSPYYPSSLLNHSTERYHLMPLIRVTFSTHVLLSITAHSQGVHWGICVRRWLEKKHISPLMENISRALD